MQRSGPAGDQGTTWNDKQNTPASFEQVYRWGRVQAAAALRNSLAQDLCIPFASDVTTGSGPGETANQLLHGCMRGLWETRIQEDMCSPFPFTFIFSIEGLVLQVSSTTTNMTTNTTKDDDDTHSRSPPTKTIPSIHNVPLSYAARSCLTLLAPPSSG